MNIYPKYNGPVRPAETNRPGTAGKAEEVTTSPSEALKAAQGSASSLERADCVEISDAGRALSARDDTGAASGLDPARAAAIRGRIMSGAYDTLEVVDAVARRLLNSGDL